MPVRLPSEATLARLAARHGLDLSDDDLAAYQRVIARALPSFTRLDELVEPKLPVRYPRTAGYRPSDAAVAPVATVQIDLRREPDAILADMRKNHRRFVRHGLRQGVEGRVGADEDLEAFHRLVVATSRRQGFEPHPFPHFAELWRVFPPRRALPQPRKHPHAADARRRPVFRDALREPLPSGAPSRLHQAAVPPRST